MGKIKARESVMKFLYKAFAKAICGAILAAAIVFNGGGRCIAAGENEVFHFYCKRNAEHKTPVIDGNISFIKENGGYYVGDASEKVIYLTFDAGYENGNIQRILDTLKKHNATGAFFILDNLIRRNCSLVERMANEGHTVCNHTAHHKDMTKINDKQEFEKELIALSSYYNEMTGKQMAHYYRPPEGKFTQRNLEFANELGFKTVFWSFAYADWDNDKQPDREKSKKLILDNTHNGMVILLHPTSKTNADILDELLTEWKSQGYRFGSLDELCV